MFLPHANHRRLWQVRPDHLNGFDKLLILLGTASGTRTLNTGNSSGTVASPPGAAVAKSSKSISPEAAAVLVAVIVPLVVIVIVLVCFFQIQKHWKTRQAQEAAALTVAASTESHNQSEGTQLYLQSKAELSVERTGSEIRRVEETYELMDRDQCQELPGEEIRQHLPSLGEQHELRGEEHASELDALPSCRNLQRYTFDEPSFGELNGSVLTLHEFA